MIQPGQEVRLVEKPTLGDAIRALASVDQDHASNLNGLGFNGRDTEFGHILASKPEWTWSPKMAAIAYKMARLYRKQLITVFGIDFDKIPAPKTAEERAAAIAEQANRGLKSLGFAPTATAASVLADRRPTREIWIDEALTIHFVYPFDWKIKDLVKQVPGAKFDGNTKEWTANFTFKSPNLAAALDLLIEDHGFATNGHTAALIAELRDRAAVKKAEYVAKLEAEALKHKEMIAASHALEGDLEIPGWSEEFPLRPFQKAGVEYALKSTRKDGVIGVIVGDEMGLGKTPQALGVLQAAEAFPALWITKASTKRGHRGELTKFLGTSRKGVVLNGTKAIDAQDADVFFINYDILGKHMESIKALGLKGLVVDESQQIKNPKTLRGKRVKEIAGASTIKAVVATTGTFIKNRPVEGILPLHVIGRLDEFGGEMAYKRRYCAPKKIWIESKQKWVWDYTGASNTEELNQKLRTICYVRREQREVQPELPEKQFALVPLLIDNMDEYRAADDEFLEMIEELRDAGGNPGAIHLRRIEALKQLAVKGKMAGVKEWINDFLEDGEEKLIVFFTHTAPLDEIMSEFPQYGPVKIDGSVDPMKRSGPGSIEERFQTDPTCRLLVANMQAAGEGLTLTAAKHIAVVEFPWVPTDVDQAAGRAYGRINDPHGVTIHFLTGLGTIDIPIAELLSSKQTVTDSVNKGERAKAMQTSIFAELLQRIAEREYRQQEAA